MRFLFVVILLSLFGNDALASDKKSLASPDSLNKKLAINDNWLTEDKAFHLASSAFITAGGFYFLHREQEVEHDKSLLISAGVSLAFGIGKEIYDRGKPNHVASWKDLVAGVFGIGVAVIMLKQ